MPSAGTAGRGNKGLLAMQALPSGNGNANQCSLSTELDEHEKQRLQVERVYCSIFAQHYCGAQEYRHWDLGNCLIRGHVRKRSERDFCVESNVFWQWLFGTCFGMKGRGNGEIPKQGNCGMARR